GCVGRRVEYPETHHAGMECMDEGFRLRLNPSYELHTLRPHVGRVLTRHRTPAVAWGLDRSQRILGQDVPVAWRGLRPGPARTDGAAEVSRWRVETRPTSATASFTSATAPGLARREPAI